MTKNIKRIYLLSEVEIVDLYARPDFNEDERKLYLTISEERELVFLNHYSNIKTRVYFILQLGYFKAKQKFFNFNLEEVRSDVEYVLANFFSSTRVILSGCVSRNYIDQQKSDILILFGYQDWSPTKHQAQMEQYFCNLLRYYPKSHNALRQLLGYFDKQQIVIPAYRKLQDMFTAAFSVEEKRLSKIIFSVPVLRQEQLTTLIDRDDGISQLNVIRADQKDFQYTAVMAEVEKAQEIAELYEFSKNFIPTLMLSKNAVRYYADVAEQYAASRLRRLSKSRQWLYVICFVYHRYQQIMDNLIISFMYHTKVIMEAGKTQADLEMMEHSASLVVDLPKLAEFLEWFPNRDKELDHDGLNRAAYHILPEKQFSALAKFLKGNTFDKTAAKWRFYSKSSRLFSLYLRPILMAVPFTHYKKDSKVIELIDLLKTHYGSGKNPSQFKLNDDLGITIPKNMITYLKREPTDKRIDPYLFEFFVYQKMLHQLDRGGLCCNDSVSYGDLDQDLVDDALVDDVEKISAEFGYPKIPIYCDKRLDNAMKMLTSAWNTTTENIHLGHNNGFNLKETKTGQQDWSLLYDSSEKLDDAFFKRLPQVELADIIMFIGDGSDMWSVFTHIKDRYIKKRKPVPLVLDGCIMSEAFGVGQIKMADMSDLNFNLLRSTREDFIRIDTLCSTNDKISKTLLNKRKNK